MLVDVQDQAAHSRDLLGGRQCTFRSWEIVDAGAK